MEVTVLDCVFCKIIVGEIPSYQLYEDDYAFSFLDINPITRGHSLVMPKKHVEKISGLNSNAMSGFALAIQRVVKGVELALNPQGLNVFVNQGEVAGQVIPHLHVHVVPRSKDDGLEIVTPKVELTKEEFLETSKRIASSIRV
jgi:histidine triad (HIT) family protein